MVKDPIPAKVLAAKLIPNTSSEILSFIDNVPEGYGSLALLSSDCDDVTYTALDESTKKADVKVIYAKSFYAGADNANTELAGEIIGILAGPNPAEVASGLDVAVNFIENEASFQMANDDGTICYYAHCISRTGSYLSREAGIPEREALAYLIAPPVEAVYALDAALKSAATELCVFYGPPTETNFAGGLLTGTQEACMAACEAFAEAVIEVAENPINY